MECEQGDCSKTFSAVSEAISAGFRTFDLAEKYSTQAEFGRALRESGIPRTEVCLISKIDGMPTGDYGVVRSRVERMLSLVGVTSFDVLLIHYPLTSNSDLSGDPKTLVASESWTVFKDTIREAWNIMSKLQRDGLCTHCGVSNFYSPHLDELFAHIDATAGEDSLGKLSPVMAAEIFVDAAHPEEALVTMLKSRHAQPLAYRPLAFVPVYGMLDGLTEVMFEAVTIAGGEVEKTSYGAILSWLLARGISPVISSSNPEHIRENARASAAVDLVPLTACLKKLSEQSEMVDMCGGCDEYAAAFKLMGQA
jgi:diketogulonate reductase-like aldo/keto reductase